MSVITMKMLRDVFKREMNRRKAPTLILVLNQSYVDLFKSNGSKLPCTVFNTTTEEYDFTAYGKQAERIQKLWEDYLQK